jgi:hypothetical protein
VLRWEEGSERLLQNIQKQQNKEGRIDIQPGHIPISYEN